MNLRGFEDQIARAVPRGIDLVWTSHEVWRQRGSILSPRLWRETITLHQGCFEPCAGMAQT
jgi:hypothetical protein